MVDQLRPNVEFLVKLVDLSNAYLIDPTGISKLAEKRGQLTKVDHEDGDAKDNNNEDPTELKGTRLGYVTVANRGDRDYRPVDRSNVLGCGALFVQA